MNTSKRQSGGAEPQPRCCPLSQLGKDQTAAHSNFGGYFSETEKTMQMVFTHKNYPRTQAFGQMMPCSAEHNEQQQVRSVKMRVR